MKINYNDMLMMLWNLEPNVAVFGDFTNWDGNEDRLIATAQQTNYKILLINKETNNLTYTIPTNGIVHKAEQFNADVIVWYAFDYQYNYDKLKSNLNCQQAIVLSNNPDLSLITQAFGVEQVVVVPYDPSLTTNIKQSKRYLQTGLFKDYYKHNGFYYSFSGFVSQGNQLGRTIGYPTANIVIDHKLTLKPGVYITQVKLPNIDHKLQGISAYWTNKNNVNVFETHILDFDQEIYGWNMEVQVEYFIRESIPIKDFAHLKQLLDADKAFALQYFKGA